MVRVQKTLTLPPDVAKRLEKEDNQSKAAEQALRQFYEIEE